MVRVFQPIHGYEVRRELASWHAEEWASVKPGSIYNALKSLAADGLLEVVGTDQVGNRPERTSYRMTLPGEEEFRALLRRAWWDIKHVTDPLMSAVAFLGLTSRAEAIAALEERITQIKSQLRNREFVLAEHDGTDSPPHVREMMRLMMARMASEIAWSEAFIERLKVGEYTTLGDPPWMPPNTERMIAERARERATRGLASKPRKKMELKTAPKAAPKAAPKTAPKTASEAVGGELKRRRVQTASSGRRTKR